jgi:gluconate:H+ symporter, GntP family
MNAALLPLVAALIAIILLVILVTFCRVHPFLSLLIVSISLGLSCQLPPADVMKQFEKGFGETLSFVGIVIGLGTMLGGLLVFSGGAERLANALVSIGGKAWIPWTIFFAALLVGLPLFFEVGFVLLVPLALVIAHKTDTPILKVGLPMLAGLSIAHGLVPPHPAPTLIVSMFHADMGRTIFYAVLVALPTGLLAGPTFAVIASNWIKTDSSALLNALARQSETSSPGHQRKSEPSLLAVIVAVLLPPVLMMSRSLISAVLPAGNALRFIAEFLGDPVMALLVALFYAIFVLGLAQGADMGRILEILNACLAPVAAIILIVGAGGGFKQMLIATKIGDMIGHWAAGAHVSPLLLGWSAAALVRIATGSATVATITGAGIAAPIIQADPTVNKELMVLATGSGSLILSHVNDAGFWLVKEYFGLTLPETFKSWTVMETILSVLGLVFSLLLGLVVH